MALFETAILRDVIANIPAASAGTAGRLFISTDEGKIYRDNGSSWDEIIIAVDTANLTYTPGDDTDWDTDTDPGDIDDALDQLAARVTDLEVSAEAFLSASGGYPSTTNGCADAAKTEFVTNDVDLYTLDFDQSTEEYAQWAFTMPDDWDAGTITAKFWWTAASGSGDVIWGLQGRAFANDDAIDQAWGTAQTVTDTLLTTGDVHVTSATSAITLAGTPSAGELVVLRAYRDADAGGDTLNADAKLIGIKLYYTRGG